MYVSKERGKGRSGRLEAVGVGLPRRAWVSEAVGISKRGKGRTKKGEKRRRETGCMRDT